MVSETDWRSNELYTKISILAEEADYNHAFLPQKDDSDFTVKDFIFKHGNKKDFYIFAFRNNTDISGFVVILPAKAEHSLSIGPMYISPKYQGLGLGKELISRIIDWAKNKDVNKLFARTWGQNNRSRRIFESLGFETISEVPNDRVNGDSTLKYVLETSKSNI